MDSTSEGAALKEVKGALKALYESGAYSDLTITCGEDVYNVHRAVICPRSEFFAKACRDKGWKEGETRQVVLQQGDIAEVHVEAQLVGWMINFFYYLDYLEPSPTDGHTVPASDSENSSQEPQQRSTTFSSPSRLLPDTPARRSQLFYPMPPKRRISLARSVSPLQTKPYEPMTTRTSPLTHARMYAIADFYGVCGLKELASKKFRDAVGEHWNSDDFAKAIQVVYTTTIAGDRGLRQVVKEILMNRMELLDKPDIEAVMREVPDLAFDVLKGTRDNLYTRWV